MISAYHSRIVDPSFLWYHHWETFTSYPPSGPKHTGGRTALFLRLAFNLWAATSVL